MFKIVMSVRDTMYKRGSLLALFLFLRLYIAAGNKTDLWIATRSMEWKPLEAHSFFIARNAQEGLSA